MSGLELFSGQCPAWNIIENFPYDIAALEYYREDVRVFSESRLGTLCCFIREGE